MPSMSYMPIPIQKKAAFSEMGPYMSNQLLSEKIARFVRFKVQKPTSPENKIQAYKHNSIQSMLVERWLRPRILI